MTLLFKALAFAALVTGSLFVAPTEPVRTIAVQKDTVEPRRFPGVFVEDSTGRPQPLSIRNLDVEVDITGTLARTTIDMTVYNPHNRVLEGEFSFPLNDGQTVARFALDINGKLREAVVVSKSKGRETFEEVIRTKIDPALLEWTRDNSFKARIYPIPAKGTRRVVIAYEQTLTNTDRGLAYTIPFAFPAVIDSFAFDCTVAGFGLKPSLTGGDGERMEFTPRGRLYSVSFTETRAHVDRPFTIDVPVSLQEHLITVNAFDNTDYVGAFLTMPPELSTAPMPKTITLLWDASLSAENRDRDAEFATLDALFKRLGSVDVRLVVFANRVFSDTRYPVRGGDWSDVRERITAIPSDGATQLGAVPFYQQDDMILLVSDGISTIGAHTPNVGQKPVHVLSTGVPADHDVLHMIARESGGAVHALGQDEPSTVVDHILGSRRMITGIRVVDGLVEDIRPTGKIPVEQITSITGRLLSESATLEIVSSIDGRDERIEEVTMNAAEHRVEGQTVARLWAMGELQRLNADRVRNADEILALGKRFTIVTPNTSLLVLERLQDYVRFNIQPPASEPALFAQWKIQRGSVVDDSLSEWRVHRMRVQHMITQRKEYLKNQPAVKLRAETPPHRYDTTRGHIVGFSDNLGAAVPVDEDVRYDPEGLNMPFQEDVASEAEWDGDAAPQMHRASDGNADGGHVLRNPLTPRRKSVLVSANGQGRVHADAVSSAAVPAPPPPPAQIQLATTRQREQWTDTLKSLKGADLYAAYLNLRPQYRSVTSFYLDVCDALYADQQRDLALRVLSNMAELKGEDARDLRILGHRLLQLGYNDLAIGVFEDVLRIRDEEPQSYRDLALALTAARRFDEAAANLTMIIEKPWHNRFPEIELIAAMELSRLVQKYGAEMDTSRINSAYLLPVETDVRVVLTWDADNCDMDLWVTDPKGEVCKYNNRDTRIGGHLSRDLSGGYGPEEFILPDAVPGTYTVKVHYYGNRQQNLARPTTVQVAMFTNYGTDEEKEVGVTLRLDGVSRIVDVGRVEVD